MTTSEELEREIERLSRERDVAVSLEFAEAETALEQQKLNEEAQRVAKEEAIKRSLEAHERQRIEDIKREQDWWEWQRANCYIPAKGGYGSMGLCQSFLQNIFDSDQQGCDWCFQCQRGWKNPSWLAGLVHS